jgi:tol-pal system protein YbgF
MRWLVFPALAAAAMGCASTGDIDLIHREITDVSRQVENLSKQTPDKDALTALSRKLTDQSAQLLKSNADIQAELQQLSAQIQTLQANLESTSQQLASLSNELAATSGRMGATVGVPATAAAAGVAGAAAGAAGAQAAGRTGEPAQLYNAAYEDYLRGNFDLGIQGFRDYVSRYPTTDLADNALYWIGECYYSKKWYKEAIDAFTQLLNTYKSSDKAAAALLKKGLAYLELGDRSQAVINLQYVLYEHPGTKEAELARSKLAGLGVKVK